MDEAQPARTSRRIGLALALMALAGFADALGFLDFGLYPSFMSGDTTTLGVALAHRERPHAGVLGGVVLIFVVGAFLGRLLRLRTRRRAAVLLSESAVLGAAAAAAALGRDAGALALLVLAMGMQNAALSHAGAVSVGTYVTGALVRAGTGLADALAGRRDADWLADLALWAGLLAGAVAGAAAFGRLGLPGVGLAALGALILAALTAGEPTDAEPPQP